MSASDWELYIKLNNVTFAKKNRTITWYDGHRLDEASLWGIVGAMACILKQQ